MLKDKVSRREFLKDTSIGVGIIGIATTAAGVAISQTPANGRDIIAAIGDTLIPSAPGDPGYRDLEPYQITDEVLKGMGGIAEEELIAFNNGSAELFGGRAFVDLGENERADYLHLILEKKIEDKKLLATCEKIYNITRVRVLTVYYQNFPEVVRRDANDLPILQPGDTHQIINPNTRKLVTGWDQAGFGGPWTWDEEEKRRAEIKKLAASIAPAFQRWEE